MLICRPVGQRVFLHRILLQRFAAHWHDAGRRFVPFDFICNRDDASLFDVRMLFEHLLDLGRIDVLSAAIEHVVRAANKIMKAVFIAAHNITSVVPTVWA